MNPEFSVKVFWEPGCFRPADAVGTKAIERVLLGFKGETGTYGIDGSGP